jgi:hypothetical protein
MRLFTLAYLAALLCTFSAQAAFLPEVPNQTGDGCVVNFDTTACFSNDPTPTERNGSKVTRCTASSRQEQGCKSCFTESDDRGNTTQKCKSVPYPGGCSCSGSGSVSSCSTPGTCDYGY